MQSLFVENFLKEDLFAMHDVGETLVNYYYNSDMPNKYNQAAKVYEHMAESALETGYNLDDRIGSVMSAVAAVAFVRSSHHRFINGIRHRTVPIHPFSCEMVLRV